LDFTIEPDMSSGSYFVAVNFLFSKQRGKVEVVGWQEFVHPRLQIDSQFSVILRDLSESPPDFKFIVSRAIHLGDSIMTLAICALFCNSTLVVKDASRMRLQETDRIKAMVTELRKVGGDDVAEETSDGFIVYPKPLHLLRPADIETYNDHRMAMCFSVLGLKVPGIRIKNPQCVSKTFPNFFEKLEQLRQ
jgi:3-phosphoshikimate 1-carboxyvinyltransferase